MAKSVAKKKNRRLRRQIRKTVGALLMVTAITVAAVPVQDISANPTDNSGANFKMKVAVLDSKQKAAGSTSVFKKADSPYTSKIPHACERDDSPEEQIIYSSGDGKYQFVYMRPTKTDNNKVAVILGYNPGLLTDSTLTIPETLEAYRKYTDNVTASGYCLVSKQNEFLHYVTKVHKRDEQGRLLYTVRNLYDDQNELLKINSDQIWREDDGTIKYRNEELVKNPETGSLETGYVFYDVDPIMDDQYNPCYYEQRDNWKDVSDQNLYYARVNEDGSLYKDAEGNLVIRQARDDDQHWKIEAEVAYIGSETVIEQNNKWVLGPEITEPDQGIFANQNNITNLIIGNNIKGISDYAFYSCGTLRSIDLSKANAVDTIGNGAFADCRNLENFNIASNANLTAIGKDAFYNCRKLTSFSVPVGVQAIGDNCFEGCVALQTVDFNGGGDSEVFLRELGYHVFKGCSSLIAVDFPPVYEETDVDIDMFEGCTSLQRIKIPNSKVNIGKFHDGKTNGVGITYPTCSMTWEDFVNTVPSTFYFEGPNVSEIHDTAKEQSIAFKYLNQELYEKMMHEHDAVKDGESKPDGTSANVLYQVNNRNELVNFVIEQGSKPDNVTIPAQIGPYGISSIGEGSFNDNCDLVKVTIPASVTSIGANAFKGCHNLETVIFTDASTITNIGTNAFKTQEADCEHVDELYPANKAKKPELYFVGAMMNDAGEDTVPFKYAMNGISNINNGSQEKIWITCHSGWPTNLEVQYKYDPIENTGEAQLVGYPRYEMINNATKAEAWVDSLPYVTSANKQEYLEKVLNATRYYEAEDKTGLTQPTEEEMRIVTSALNVAIPSSVDSIKPGLFSGYTYDEDGEPTKVLDEDGNPINPDEYIQSVLINGVDTIEPYTFKDCIKLNSADIIGSKYIDDYAFDDCKALQSVTLGTNLVDTGKRPFRGCDKLTNVKCLDADFSYANGIIYRNTGSGTEIVECLEGRGKIVGSYTVGPDEFTGITSIKEEAFADCDEIGKVDLSFTTVDTIPEGCFKETDDLNTVILPDTVKNIEEESFANSNIRVLTIPGNQAYIAKDAFAHPADQQTIIFECIEGTTADRYAKEKENWYINPEYGKVYLEHTVIFWDYPYYPDTTTQVKFAEMKVRDGDDAVPPSPAPSHNGYQLSRWTNYTNISKDTDVYPVFGSNIYEVRFLDWDSKLLGDVQYVEEGRSAVPPAEPTREGYTFDRWSQDWNNVTEDRIITAIYVDNSSDSSRHTVQFYDYDGKLLYTQYVNDGEDAIKPEAPARSGYTFTGWIPADHLLNVTENRTVTANYLPAKNNSSGGNDGNGSSGSNGSNGSPSPSVSPSASPSESPSVTKYTVSVSGGSGSGSYAAGEIVALNAYFMGEGQSFDKWTTSTAGVGFANPNASSTTFTMPAANVAITATYKTGSGSSTANNGTSGGGSTPSGTNNGTTVEVTKPGISNTGLAGATVSGATDNFIVKVTEQQAATDASVAALQARYGDLSRIKYFPMDISLYDSTGRTKIADTSGITVNITLPLPDDMVQYAGNNRVAAVANGALEDLNARFTTVDGVPCINFTATHFSPYVIYVDTANLSEGTIDVTPKTGDPIHPKWFLAIGLACVSLILFFKKDKLPVNTKTA